MAVITYREAVAWGIAQEMRRDPNVVFLGEDVAAAGGVFKTTVGLLEEFGPQRVRDTPISEQAILGAAVGAAMTGLRPIAEIMFSDFFAVCWDLIANEMAKIRYMSDGQLALPLVVRCANGAGVRFGAQHSQSVENWAMAVPGLKVVAPSSPRDVVGLLAAAVRDPDPVVFFEHKGLMASKGDVPEGTEVLDELGRAKVLRPGGDATILALAAMVPLWGLRDFEHRRALAALRARTYESADALRVGAYPTYVNPFTWYGVVETRDFFALTEVDSLRPEIDPRAKMEILYKPEETSITLAAKRSYLGRVYLDWAAFPITETTTRPDGGWIVEFHDLRFEGPLRVGGRHPLAAGVSLNREGKVQAEFMGPVPQPAPD